jgi:peptidoglycan/LPS O-acetylase OafA/YrhL
MHPFQEELIVPAEVSSHGRLADLDAIRGIAIGQVLLWHLWVPAFEKHAPFLARVLGLSWTGVDLFFVLSGYLIGGILLANQTAGNFYAVFYGRRVLRIIPLYILLIASYLIFFKPDMIWPYLTFTQNFAWASNKQIEFVWGGWTGPTWSLAVEEQFYLVLPMLIRMTSPRRLPWILLMLCIAAPLVRCVAVLWLYGQPYAAYLLMPCRMDALFGGVLLAWATRQPQFMDWMARRRRLVYLIIGILGAGILLLLLAPGRQDLSPLMWSVGFSWVAAFYAGILLLTVTRRRRSYLPPAIRPLCWLGIGAYSLYLFHRPIEIMTRAVFSQVPAVPFVATAVSFVVALLCWKMIERQCIAAGRRYWRYEPRAVSDVRPGTSSPE